MKKIFLTLSMLATSLLAVAAPRSQADALAIARQFMGKTAPVTGVRKAKTMAQYEAPAYYVVNMQEGFVIVSGDDAFKPVLGYSMQGNIDENTPLPDGLQYWLGFLTEEMEAAKAQGYRRKVTASGEDFAMSVYPLCTTKWNQTTPFNNLIPSWATGCVATAMAQVMKYWNYPLHGIGTHTNAYFPNYSADFGATTYDWANMKDEYGGKYDTKAQVSAVATLMLHLGIATDMQWTKDNSATSNLSAAYAFIKFFGYNKFLHVETRDHVSPEAWRNIVLEQLLNNRPICYAGYTSQDSNYGHFFVCDGYDAETGKFHFNWGWGGNYDGYFELSSLAPGGQGEAGALTGNFNYRQLILADVQPTETGEYTPRFDCDEVYPSSKDCLQKNVVITTQRMSNHALDFKGAIGLALYHADGSHYMYVPSSQAFPGNLSVGNSYPGAHDVEVDLSRVEDGSYVACLAVCHENYPTRYFPVRAFYNKPTFYNVTVAGGRVSFSEYDGELTGIKAIHDSQPTTHNSQFTFNLRGQRVKAATGKSLRKGIYVVNGKLQVVK